MRQSLRSLGCLSLRPKLAPPLVQLPEPPLVPLLELPLVPLPEPLLVLLPEPPLVKLPEPPLAPLPELPMVPLPELPPGPPPELLPVQAQSLAQQPRERCRLLAYQYRCRVRQSLHPLGRQSLRPPGELVLELEPGLELELALQPMFPPEGMEGETAAASPKLAPPLVPRPEQPTGRCRLLTYQ